MDEIVMRAMQRWPDVPDAYGWLSLDRRGRWRIKGERIGNAVLSAFIDRNYAADARGRWFFQNGPQRVYVRLECAPFVLVHAGDGWRTHTGLPVITVRRAHAAADTLVLLTEHGPAAVSDRDLPVALDAVVDARGAPLGDEALDRWLEDGSGDAWFAHGDARLPIVRAGLDALAAEYGFVPDPRPASGEPEC